MSPPESVSGARPESVPPYRLELGGGYSSVDLGIPGHHYQGGHYEARMGQSFPVHPRHAFFINGLFRHGFLENESGSNLELIHFGFEGGYEAWIVPQQLSALLFAGMGTNIFYSQDFEGGPHTSSLIDNESAFALTLGGGLSFLRGIINLRAAWQPNFGLGVHYEDPTVPPDGYNPQAWMVSLGINVAALADFAGATLPRDRSFAHFFEGSKFGVITDTNYTYNFRRPSDGTNTLRLFDNRWDRPMGNAYEVSFDRPTDEEHPFGLRADLVFGEDSAGAAPRTTLRTTWMYLQQLYASFRLPIHRGITLRAGQFATPIGGEVLEGPLNNQISRSLQFNYAIPFTHTGLLADIPFTEQVSLTLGPVHGWDNVVGHDAGVAGLAALTVNWIPELSTTVASTVGQESGRLRTFLNGLVIYRPTGNADDGSIMAEYDWGHEEAGAGAPEANWHSVSLGGRYNFYRGNAGVVGASARGEVFVDSEGVRTGTSQTLGSATATLHYETPTLAGIRPIIRLEYRHDEASAESFFSGDQPTSSQDTLALGFGTVF